MVFASGLGRALAVHVGPMKVFANRAATLPLKHATQSLYLAGPSYTGCLQTPEADKVRHDAAQVIGLLFVISRMSDL